VTAPLRRCPVDGCSELIAFADQMCREHWKLVPREHRVPLTAAWKLLQTVPNGESMERYRGLQRKAIELAQARAATPQ